MAEATNWVTVKVPESDKEKAKDYRPEGATFGDCLVAGAERLNDYLASDTASYLDEPLREDTARKVVDEIRDQLGIEGDADIAEIVSQLSSESDTPDDQIISDGAAGVLEATKSDVERLTEMIDRLPEQTADEIEGRMR